MVLVTEGTKDNTLLTVFLQKIEYLTNEERKVILRIIKSIYNYDKVPIEEEWVNLKRNKKEVDK